ncbi:UNVERIFIED_CONTAM: WD domain repeat-containing protein 55 [Siphonaria sp. JEL0065]|nr:WD domain repeat-containing protein 55 [Siphonaria sp. JEL0065]
MPYISIKCENDVTGLSFHPTESNIVATCEISGVVSCYKFSEEDSEQLFTAKYHKGSCRIVEFNGDGRELYSGGKDKSLQILDTTTGKPILKKAAAHTEPINCLAPLDPNIVVTGDEGGIVKIWDTRERKLVMKYSVNEDFISDFAYVSDKSTLLATSADGRLSVFDIRKKKPIKVSDNQDDELLSVVLVKDTKKAVVGSEDGILSIFSWDNWGDLTDRIPSGHPGSINSIAKLDESRILTGCSDGKIRLVSVFPNKVLSSLRDHNVDLPIEKIRLNCEGGVLGSCSHEDVVRFWDVGDLGFDEDEDDSDEIEEDSDDTGEFEDDEDAVDAQVEAGEEKEDDGNSVIGEDEEIVVKKQPKMKTEKPGKRNSADSDVSDSDNDSKPQKSEKKPQSKKHRPNATQNAFFGDLD